MTRRTPALLAIAAVLVAGGVADRTKRPRPSTSATATASADAPAVAPRSAVNSTWYCAGGTAAPGGAAAASVIVANPGDRAVTGTVTAVSSDAAVPPKQVPLSVGPRAVTVVPYDQILTAPFASVLVDMDGGGGVAVEHSVTGPLGADVAPCASAGSTRWYFADGATTKDASDVYTLFNPFPEDAIVDISFSTEQGRLNPQGMQAMVVPKGRLVAVNVGNEVIRRKAVSASIVARRGRIVADKIQTYDGTAGRKGLALVLGAAAPSEEWFFPHGVVVDGLTERYQIYNPTDREATVDLELSLDQGSAEPIEVTVAAQGRETVLMNAETRLPKGVGHSVAVRSQNGVAVVVERSFDGAKPSSFTGLASTMGAPAPARAWTFAAGLATDAVDDVLALFNPGDREASVRISTFAGGQLRPIAALDQVRLAPGRRTSVRLRDVAGLSPSLPLVVTSDRPVVAERGLVRVKALGMSFVIGIRGEN